MVSMGDLVIDIGADATLFKRGINDSRKGLKGFVDGALSGFSKIGLAANGLKTVMGAISEPLELAKTQALNERKLEQVFKTTGNAAGIAAKHVKAFAAERQNLTSFGDEDTINAAAILGSFTNVRGNAFTDALVSAQDLSAFLGTDLQSSIIMIGKALNDPARGLTALSKAGIQFSDSQKESIKALQQTGKIADAQKIILKELQTQFGGQAEALVDPIQQAKNAWGDFLEIVGNEMRQKILPLMPQLIESFQVMATIAVQVFNELNDLVKFMEHAINNVKKAGEDLGVIKKPEPFVPDPNQKPVTPQDIPGMIGGLGEMPIFGDLFKSAGNTLKEAMRPAAEGFAVAANDLQRLPEELAMAQAKVDQQKEAESMARLFLAGGIEDARNWLNKTFDAIGPLDKEAKEAKEADQQLGALEKGSQETSDVLQANFNAGKNKVPEKQLAEAQKHTKMLEEIKKNLMAKAQSVFEVKGLN